MYKFTDYQLQKILDFASKYHTKVLFAEGSVATCYATGIDRFIEATKTYFRRSSAFDYDWRAFESVNIINGDEKEIQEYPVDELRFKRRQKKDKVKLSAEEMKELEKLEKQDKTAPLEG